MLIIGFSFGLYARPAIENTYKRIDTYFNPPAVRYQAEKVTTDEERKISEYMQSDEVQQIAYALAAAKYYKEKSLGAVKQEIEYSAKYQLESDRASYKSNDFTKIPIDQLLGLSTSTEKY